MKTSRDRNRKKKCLLLLFSILVSLGLAEVILRLLGTTTPVIYRHDDRYGYEPAPNQVSPRLGVTVYCNDLGLRDDEDFAGMAGAEFVLLMRDSATYGGSRIAQQDLFTELLERKLRGTRPGIKVLNAGVNGYSVYQMTERAARLVREIQPEYVVFYLINLDLFRPPARYIRDGNTVLPTREPRCALTMFLRQSVSFMNRRYKFLPASWRDVLSPSPFKETAFDRSRVPNVNFEAIQNFLASSWEAAGKDRKRVIFLIAADRLDGLAPLENMNAYILEQFEKEGIRAWNTTDEFISLMRERGVDADDCFWDHVHYRRDGHAVAAEVIYNRLEPLLE
jgi:lysophospholipase L1-like esterase